jgi:catechol 2,3-dioxygenase-like lactoylglutathione lyase family enzyme
MPPIRGVDCENRLCLIGIAGTALDLRKIGTKGPKPPEKPDKCLSQCATRALECPRNIRYRNLGSISVGSAPLRLNHVTLGVSEVEASARFYVRLGLEQIVADYPTYARLLAPRGGTTLSLHRREGPTTEPTSSIHFEVDDVDLQTRRLEQAGFEFILQPTDQPYLWREAVLLDPDGHRLFIYHAGENRLDPPWRLPRDPRGGHADLTEPDTA